MFETLVAWKYLFQPRLQPKITAWLIVCLIQVAAGTVLYYKIPEPLIALLWSAAPIWLIYVVSALVKKQLSKSEPENGGEQVYKQNGPEKTFGSLTGVTGTVGMFQALLLISILLSRYNPHLFALIIVCPLFASLLIWETKRRMKLRADSRIRLQDRGRRDARPARREEGEQLAVTNPVSRIFRAASTDRTEFRPSQYMDVCNRRETQQGGMDRRTNPEVILESALKWGSALKRSMGLTVAGFATMLLTISITNISVQYVGAFLIAGSSLLAVVFFLTCFFSVFTTISITGVILGAASLVMVRAVTRGFGQEFQDKVLGFNAHVLVMKNTYGFTEYPDVLKTVRNIKHVTGAAPFTIAEMIITHEKKHTTVLMKGVDPKRVEEVLDLTTYVQADSKKELNQVMSGMDQNLDKGLVGPGQKGSCQRFDDDGDPIPGIVKNCKLPGIMLGRDLAKTLRVKKGSVVRLISPTAEYRKYDLDEKKDTVGHPPLARDFRVSGTFYCGFEEYDQKMAFVHLKAAQRFVNPHALPEEENAVLGIEIKLDDVYKAGEVARDIELALGTADYRIVTWDQLNRPLFEALRTQKLIMTLIAFVMVIVAGFGILAALSMMVINKTREIAVLKAMGASAGGVSRVFQLAGVMVGMVGVGCGVGLGILNCHFLSGLNFPLDPKVYLISRLPVLVDWGEMLSVLGAGLILCFLSTLYPSHKASSFHPVDGLRYE